MVPCLLHSLAPPLTVHSWPQISFDSGVRLDRVRGGRQKYKRRPEQENATYQSAPIPLRKEGEKECVCMSGQNIRKIYLTLLRIQQTSLSHTHTFSHTHTHTPTHTYTHTHSHTHTQWVCSSLASIRSHINRKAVRHSRRVTGRWPEVTSPLTRLF